MAEQELADVHAQEGAVEPGVIGSEQPEKVASENRPEKPLSVRETINKSIAKVREDEKGRLHAKDGKFAPKTEAAPSAPVEIPKTEKDAQPKEPSTAIGPPPGWSAESKAAFNALPDHIKNDLVKREKEVSDGFKKYSDTDKRYQEIEQVLAPIRSTYQQAGVKSDAEAIKSLLGWEASFRNPNTRVQAFHNLARQYGINLNSPQPQAQDAGIPDQLRPVLDQFGQISQQVSTIQGELQRSREEQVSKTLTDFAKDKPHFEKVRVKMGQLIQAGVVPPSDLDGAYQQAIWADENIRAALVKEQFDKQQADLVKANITRTQAARQAAISPSSRAPAATISGKPNGKLSARDSIVASIRELREERA